MKNSKKKGFTLVELIVVIAIIAILSTVAIVGYSAFIKKANLSNDKKMIEMWNEILDAEFVAEAPATAGEAMQALRASSVYGDKFVTYSEGFHYAYDLEKNQMVLFDDADELVYPSKASDNIWGLYANEPNNKVDGLTQYVAVTPISNTTALAAIFADNYEFDLNGYVLKANVAQLANVTAFGGIVTSASNVKVEGIVPMESTTFNANTTAYENKVVALSSSNKVPAGTTFTDCVIEIDAQGNTTSPVKVTNPGVVFENCTFIGAQKWTIQVNSAATIKNCKFLNCTRGINIIASEAEKVVIENNVFELAADEKANAIQLAGNSLNANFELTFKNNEVVSANTVICLHEGLALMSEADLNALDDKITFENNTYGTINENKVIVDPDADASEVAKIQVIVDAVAAKVK